jgi:hypothetical protein
MITYKIPKQKNKKSQNDYFYLHLKQLRRNLGVDPFSFCSKKERREIRLKISTRRKNR